MFSPICNTTDLKLKTSKGSFAVCLGIESHVVVYTVKHCWSIIGHCPQGYKTRKKMLISFSTALTIGHQTLWIWGYESSDLWWTDKHYWTTTTTMKVRSEEHTSELQSHVRISYAVFCLKKKKKTKHKVEICETTINRVQLALVWC